MLRPLGGLCESGLPGPRQAELHQLTPAWGPHTGPTQGGHLVCSTYVCLSSLQTQAEELSREHRSFLNAQATMKCQLLTGQLRESPEKPGAVAARHLMGRFGVEAALVVNGHLDRSNLRGN